MRSGIITEDRPFDAEEDESGFCVPDHEIKSAAVGFRFLQLQLVERSVQRSRQKSGAVGNQGHRSRRRSSEFIIENKNRQERVARRLERQLLRSRGGS